MDVVELLSVIDGVLSGVLNVELTEDAVRKIVFIASDDITPLIEDIIIVVCSIGLVDVVSCNAVLIDLLCVIKFRETL